MNTADLIRALGSQLNMNVNLNFNIQSIFLMFNQIEEQADKSSDKVKAAFGKLSTWLNSKAQEALKAAVKTITEVDEKMNKLNKVMSPNTNINEMLSESVSLAKQYGHELNKVLDTTISLAGKGLNERQTMKVTESAIVAQNVTDLSSDETINTLTGAMNNFNIEANDSTRIVDALNEVHNTFSYSTKDLAQAMNKAGGDAKQYGVTMEQLLGHVTAIGAVTQESGENIGQSLSTVYTNISKNSSIEELSNVGIAIRESVSGELKSASAVLDELGKKWDTLAPQEQIDITKSLGGEHVKPFIALMSNYQTAVRGTETALNSQGSAMRDNETYMQSLEGRIHQMKSAWQELALGMGDSFLTNALMGLINVATSVANSFLWLTEHIGGTTVVFLLLSTRITKLAHELKSFFTANKLAIAAMFGFVPATTAASGGVQRLSFSVNQLKASLRSLLISSGIGLIFATLGFVAEKVIGMFGNANDGLEQMAENSEKLSQSISDQKNLEKLAQGYEELAKKQSLSTDEQMKLSSIESELQSKYGITLNALDGSNSAYQENIEFIKMKISLLKEETAALREKAALEYQSKQSEIDSEIDKQSKHVEEAQKKKLEKQNELIEARKKLDSIPQDDKYQTPRHWARKDVEKASQSVQAANEELEKAEEKLSNASSTKLRALQANYNQFLDGMTESNVKVKNSTRELFGILAEVMSSTGQNLSDKELNNLFDIFQNQDIKTVEQFQTALKNTNSEVKITGNLLKEISDGLAGMKVNPQFIEDMNKIHEKITNKDTFKNALNEYGPELKRLNQIVYDLKNSQALSAEQVAELIKEYPELTDKVKKNADGYSIEIDVLEELREERIKKAIDSMNKDKEESIAALKNALTRISAYNEELGTIRDAKDARERINQLLNKRNSEVKSPFGELPFPAPFPKQVKESPEFKKQNDEINTRIDKTVSVLSTFSFSTDAREERIKTAIALLKDPNYGVTSKSTSKSSSSPSSGKDEKEKEETFTSSIKFNKEEEAINKVNASLETNQRQIDEAIASGKSYNQHLTKRISLYNDLLTVLNNLRKVQNDEKFALKQKLTAHGLVDKNGEVVADVGGKLEKIAKDKKNTEFAKKLEQDVEDYISVTNSLNETRSKIDQAVMSLSEGYSKKWEANQNKHKKKQDDIKHNIAMLGEIDTPEEKKKYAQYVESGYQDSLQERRELNNEIYTAQSTLKNPKKTAEQKRAAAVYLESLTGLMQGKDEELVKQAEDTGKAQAEAMVAGFEQNIEKLKQEKELLGSLDTEEKKKRAVQIDKQIADQYVQMNLDINTQLIELERKLDTDLGPAEKARIQFKLQLLQKYHQDARKQIVDFHDAEVRTKSEQADKIIDNLKKLYQKEKELKEQAVEEEIRKENDRYEERTKLLDKDLKNYEKYINAQLKSFDRANAEDDYEEQLKKLIQERQLLQDKLNVLAMDSSFEAKVKRKNIQEQLDTKNEEISKYKRDHEREQRKNGLQDQLEDRREIIEKQKELEEEAHKNKLDDLDKEKKKIDQHYKGLLEDEERYHNLKAVLLGNDTVKINEELSKIRGAYNVFFDYLATQSEIIGEKMFKNLNSSFKQDFNDFTKFTDHDSKSSNGSPSTSNGNSGQSGGNSDQSQQLRDWEQYLDNKKRAEALAQKVIKNKNDPNIKTWKQEIEKLRKANDILRAKHHFLDGSFKELENKKPPFSAESGGITPQFSGPKWLLAHEKEIVLNKSDTSNMLKIVDMTRNIVGSMKAWKPDAFSLKMPNQGASMNSNSSSSINISKVEINANDRDTGESLLDKFKSALNTSLRHRTI
ncbi:phage tail tape measure protein [Paenibacillus popilliae]|uniref:Phage tail tape measure protein n=1 Tax=Paenibacillus popilliae TaxID=78057 RepID=A0ABY3AVB3_PAEPP|nr:phage tail tape measure protein [Paenibacillus sp. SDF0028]TQR46752.1 phage tail tape measure protein [Paenibacillus sp. SDF0028]